LHKHLLLKEFVTRKEAARNIRKLVDYIEEPPPERPDQHVEHQIIATAIRTLGAVMIGVWGEMEDISDELMKIRKQMKSERQSHG
jgi:hypothetical protein